MRLADHDVHVRRAGWQRIEHCGSLPEKSKQEADSRIEHAGHEDTQDDDHRGESEGLSHTSVRRRRLIEQHRPCRRPLYVAVPPAVNLAGQSCVVGERGTFRRRESL